MRFEQISYLDAKERFKDDLGLVFTDLRDSPENLIEPMVTQMHDKGIFDSQDYNLLFKHTGYIVARERSNDLLLLFDRLNIIDYKAFVSEVRRVENLMSIDRYIESDEYHYECAFCGNIFPTLNENYVECPDCNKKLELC